MLLHIVDPRNQHLSATHIRFDAFSVGTEASIVVFNAKKQPINATELTAACCLLLKDGTTKDKLQSALLPLCRLSRILYGFYLFPLLISF